MTLNGDRTCQTCRFHVRLTINDDFLWFKRNYIRDVCRRIGADGEGCDWARTNEWLCGPKGDLWESL